MATPETLPATRIITRREIVEKAQGWIETPYAHQGRTRAGLDCIGLILVVGADLGLDASAPRAYTAMPKGGQLVNPCEERLWKPKDQTKLQPGDIGLFWAWNTAEPQHFVIMGTVPHGLTVIHAYSKFRKVVEMPFGKGFQAKFYARYVFPGTEAEWA